VAENAPTGKQWLLRYAFPCAEERFFLGKISEEQLGEIERLARNNGEASEQLLETCFPDAMKERRKYAQARGIEELSPADEIDFWRNHHDQDGCKVLRGEIISTDGVAAWVKCGEQKLLAINYYNLPLDNKRVVYLHCRVIVDAEI